MSAVSSDAELRRRGTRTLITSWEKIAAGTAGAEVHHLDGVVAAVFPSGPERDVYNNAVLTEGLSKPARTEAIEATESGSRKAGVEH